MTPNKKIIYRPDASSDYIVTAIPSVPATEERLPFTEWHVLKQAGVARANIAPTEWRLDGTTDGNYSKQHANHTVLQQHIDYFDLNRDGIITPFETYIGFRLLKWNILFCIIAVMIIHTGFSYVTLPRGQWFPDPLFRIYVANIHSAKHGGDTGTYDAEGRFIPQLFADFFSKYGRKMDDGDWGLTFAQALHGARCQRCVADPFGWLSAFFEWAATYLTIWPEDGVMRMEDVRAVYDGSYFHKVAGNRRQQYLPKQHMN